MGLAGVRERLAADGLTPGVIDTIQGARALSTRTLYDSRWKAFHKWCLAQSPRLDSFQAPIGEVLRFLQDRVDAGLTFSTVKVWLASITACHIGYDGVRVSEHPWVPPFMKGVKRLRARSKGLFPSWDLPVVLEGLCKPPFEPLESADLKFLTLKTVLLVALTTTKRVSDIKALSVSQEYLRFSADGETVWLRPNSDFVAKNLLVPELPVELCTVSVRLERCASTCRRLVVAELLLSSLSPLLRARNIRQWPDLPCPGGLWRPSDWPTLVQVLQSLKG